MKLYNWKIVTTLKHSSFTSKTGCQKKLPFMTFSAFSVWLKTRTKIQFSSSCKAPKMKSRFSSQKMKTSINGNVCLLMMDQFCQQLMILCRVQTLNLHLMLYLTISWISKKKIRKYLNNLCMNKQYNTTPYDANSPKHVKNGTVFFFVRVKIVFSFLIKIIVRNF